MAPFATQQHMIQNMGDGTYSHSGALAIRAAIAADVNMTFKVLLNGYISMTGGQAIPGGLSAQHLAAQLLAEGARKVVVVTDDLGHYEGAAPFPEGVEVVDRDELIRVQEDLQKIEGVTGLIYDQACAAELRRERKRGNAVDPDKRTFIHETVCEGCGDCNVQSNCISVEPLETDLGRKRLINQSTCNKDFSCVDGYCPSFVTLYGATPRRRGKTGAAAAGDLFAALPAPGGRRLLAAVQHRRRRHRRWWRADHRRPARHGRARRGQDGDGAQRVRAGPEERRRAEPHPRRQDPQAQLAPRINVRSADVVIGADIVVVSGPDPIATMDKGRTWAIVNDDVRPTVAFSRNGNLDLSSGSMSRLLRRATGDHVELIDANHLAAALMGDSIYANLLLLGYALQKGRLPVSAEALDRAIELNGVAIANNHEALKWGRLAAHDLPAVLGSSAPRRRRPPSPAPVEPQTVEELIAHRVAFLTDYQDARYAARYAADVRPHRRRRAAATPGHDQLGWAVARHLFKLMAYKDEYEVARLYADPAFKRRLDEAFEGDFTWKVNLAPQLFNRRDASTGRAKKWEIPSTVAMPMFKALAAGRRLRGTKLDVFGKTAHRRAERALIDDYRTLLDEIAVVARRDEPRRRRPAGLDPRHDPRLRHGQGPGGRRGQGEAARCCSGAPRLNAHVGERPDRFLEREVGDMTTMDRVDTTYRLEDRFERQAGRVYLTGWDALVRLPLMQRAPRRAAPG